jgi:hypothetical protein
VKTEEGLQTWSALGSSPFGGYNGNMGPNKHHDKGPTGSCLTRTNTQEHPSWQGEVEHLYTVQKEATAPQAWMFNGCFLRQSKVTMVLRREERESVSIYLVLEILTYLEFQNSVTLSVIRLLRHTTCALSVMDKLIF